MAAAMTQRLATASCTMSRHGRDRHIARPRAKKHKKQQRLTWRSGFPVESVFRWCVGCVVLCCRRAAGTVGESRWVSVLADIDVHDGRSRGIVGHWCWEWW
jgi:hypothetical protein